MSLGFLTTQVTGRAQVALVRAGDGPALIANNDISNTIWVSNDFGVQPNAGNAAPLPPQSTIVVDGKQDVYAVALPGQTVTVFVVPGGLNFFQLVNLIIKTLVINGVGSSISSGIFVYDGIGAPGNGPILSIIPDGVPHQDPYGNLALPIFNVGQMAGAHTGWDDVGDLFFSDPTGVVRLNIFTGGNSVNGGNPVISFQNASSVVTFYVGNNGLGQPRIRFTNLSGADLGIENLTYTGGKFIYQDLGSATQGNLVAAITDKANVVDPDFGTTLVKAGLTIASLLAFDPNNANIQETWHSMSGSLAAGFTAGGTTPRYRLEPTGNGVVRLNGAINLTANQVANTTFFTLPAGYRPASNKFLLCINDLTGAIATNAVISIDTSGHMNIDVAGNNGQFIGLDGVTFDLD